VTLAERVALAIRNEPRLAAVPPAVVEDVLRLGLGWLADHVPAGFDASEMTAVEFEACESCGSLVDPADPKGAVYGGEDGIWLCDACVVEAAAAAPEGCHNCAHVPAGGASCAAPGMVVLLQAGEPTPRPENGGIDCERHKAIEVAP
jgi:hypothetical protein